MEELRSQDSTEQQVNVNSNVIVQCHVEDRQAPTQLQSKNQDNTDYNGNAYTTPRHKVEALNVL